MRAFEITNQKRLMQMLLSEDAFDEFLLNEATVVKGASLILEGRADEDNVPLYKDYKNVLYEFIKGRQTPSYLKVVLISPEERKGVSSRAINILYRDGRMSVTTGVARSTFSPDKSVENEWDSEVEAFLKSKSADIDFLG